MRRFLVCGMALMLTGCGIMNSQLVVQPHYPIGYFSPRNPQNILFLNMQPQRPYKVVGEASYSGSGLYPEELTRLRSSIAAMGGDAAICQSSSQCSASPPQQPQPQQVTNNVTNNYYGYGYRPTYQVLDAPRGTYDYPPSALEQIAEIGKGQPTCVTSTSCRIIRFED